MQESDPFEQRTSWVPIEQDRPFGESCLWELQVAYYAARGVDAWRRDGVPHYVTSNPALAHAYARLLWAWWNGEVRRNSGLGGHQPRIVLELGAGSGVFSFQLLTELQAISSHDATDRGFRYVMTDVAEANLDFWLDHPWLQPFFDSGLLDVAAFDVRYPGPIELRRSGERLILSDPSPSVAVIANYVLDSVPQDLFFLDAGRLHESLCSVVCTVDPTTLPVSEVVEHLLFRFSNRLLAAPPYGNEGLDRLLGWYLDHLQRTYVLFPATALACIDVFRRLGGGRLLFLAADKGRDRAEQLDGIGPPVIVQHGSFSIDVNFHALAMHCTEAGGTALFPDTSAPAGITVGCLAYGDEEELAELRREYDRVVRDFGPDDCYRVLRGLSHRAGEMGIEDLLALVRLARHDPLHVQVLLPRLRELTPTLTNPDRETLVSTLDRVWDHYFPLGGDEEFDLAFEFGSLCYLTGNFDRAAFYFSRSVSTCGPSTGALLNLAACQEQLRKPAEATQLLALVIEHDPTNVVAKALLARCRATIEKCPALLDTATDR